MIKNIVFDMGNVLIRYVPEEFIGAFTEHTSEQEQLLNMIFRSQRWLDYDRGTITKEQLVQGANKELPAAMHSLVHDVSDTWYEGMTVNAEMNSVIDGLKSNNYSLYLLSNTSQDFYIFKESIPVLNHFDGLFISSDWQSLKPEAVIFQQFFDHFNLNPEECFFIDDLSDNINAASEHGMAGHVFDGDMKALIAAFESNNINFK